jgi:hypothetical protein
LIPSEEDEKGISKRGMNQKSGLLCSTFIRREECKCARLIFVDLCFVEFFLAECGDSIVIITPSGISPALGFIERCGLCIRLISELACKSGKDFQEAL